MQYKIVALIRLVGLLTVLATQSWLFSPSIAQAQNGIATYKGVDSSIKAFLCTPSADGYALYNCINRLYRFSIAFGAVMLVFFVVLAGYFYLTGDESGKTKGKEIFFKALLGMGILLFSYVFLRFLNPNLTMYKLIQPPIFNAQKVDCKSAGFGEGCGGTASSGGSSGGPAGIEKVSDLNNKKVLMFGDSLTKKFYEQLTLKVKLANGSKVNGCGRTTTKGWIDGGEQGVDKCQTTAIQNLIKGVDKGTVILIMLGTNDINSSVVPQPGVKPDLVSQVDKLLQDYTAIWIAPPKFPQTNCYSITPDMSTAADNVIASNFKGTNHSVFKSADKSIDLNIKEKINCQRGVGKSLIAIDPNLQDYDIHPQGIGNTNWVNAFLGK